MRTRAASVYRHFYNAMCQSLPIGVSSPVRCSPFLTFRQHRVVASFTQNPDNLNLGNGDNLCLVGLWYADVDGKDFPARRMAGDQESALAHLGVEAVVSASPVCIGDVQIDAHALEMAAQGLSSPVVGLDTVGPDLPVPSILEPTGLGRPGLQFLVKGGKFIEDDIDVGAGASCPELEP